MLRINKIHLENFGPYYGENDITFSQTDGVTIIWGANGYGKTTIMNAFRYALWGSLLGRRRQHIDPHTYVNYLARPEKGNMRVEVYMTYNGKDCIVTRGLNRVGGDGKSQEDYETLFMLKVDSHTLNREDSEMFLSDAFPDRISRFYLFDGELLNEYEDLLDEGDASGAKIKESIEDILGIPVLENAELNLSNIKKAFNREAASLSKKDQSTEKLSADLQANQELRDHLLESKQQLEEKETALLREQGDIEQEMLDNQLFSSLATERKVKREAYDGYKAELEKTKVQVSPLIDKSWRIMLNPVIDSALDKLEASVAEINKKESDAIALASLSAFVSNALHEHPDICPACGSNISSDVLSHMLSHFNKDNVASLSTEDKEKLQATKATIALLKSSLVGDSKAEIKIFLDRIDDLQVKMDLTSAQIDSLTDKISKLSASATEDEIIELPKRHERCIKKLAENRIEKAKNEEDLKTAEAAIDTLTKLIQKNSKNPDVSIALAREAFADRLCSLFGDSIAKFRDKQKVDVERDASSLFRSITNDPEYERLVINENYGMQIAWSDGELVPNRSSGYEQVVAIALIGALHKNAPIEGPIFMDSTFQRVDEYHKNKIIKNLPEFGHQVIVLAYDTEMGSKEDVRAILGTALLQEYRLDHLNSKETKISK